MTQKSNIVYPLSEKTVHNVFLKIFYPLTKNQSVTVSVRTQFGGVRNILRFFIDRYEYLADQVQLDLNTSNWKFLYFDSDLLLDESPYEYLRIIYNVCAEEFGWEKIAGDELSYKQLWIKTRDKFKQLADLNDVKIIMIFPTINFLLFLKQNFWRNVRNLCTNPDFMHFLFIIYEGAQLKINDLRFKRLHRYLFQNIVELTDINDEDIDYLIDFWSDQEIKDKRIRKVIKEVGEGYPQLIKSCCLALNVKGENYSNPDELKEFFINHPNIQRIKLRLSGHGITKYDSLTGNMYINGVNAIDVLTKIESEIVIQLFQASSVGLRKEDIAEIMWKEDENINYSDSAISQQIYRLRTKLENMGLDRDIIKTVPKKGYVWNEV